ncbi:MAG: hypothetical protein HGA45_15660 [Chloroflexales bacterium]|nr:hypothetical protein [Chloroflexales bacterium]
MNTIAKTRKETPIRGEDIPRWLIFTSFWGGISYLLTFVSLLVGSRRNPTQINRTTLGLGFLLHTSSFMVGGSLIVAAVSIIRGKSSTAIAQEDIRSGQLGRSIIQLGGVGALGSVVPFTLAVGSIELARTITGQPAIGEADGQNWPLTIGTMAAASGMLSLAVSRITAWVAQDARSA